MTETRATYTISRNWLPDLPDGEEFRVWMFRNGEEYSTVDLRARFKALEGHEAAEVLTCHNERYAGVALGPVRKAAG